MRRLLLFAVGLLTVSSFPTIGQAQVGSAGLISPEAARLAGLERMWFTQLALDRGRGRVSGVHMHVSPTQSHTVFQITAAGKRYVFSQRDRDAFGKEIGVEGAKALADAKAVAIQEDAAKAGPSDAPLPTVESFVVPKITIYASSERGMVHALDGETGRTLWTTSVGNPLYPTTAPAANDKYVGVCNGSTIYVMLAESGAVIWSRPAVSAPGAGPALTEEYIFVPMISGQVESYLLDDPRQPAGFYKSFGRAMVQPVVSTNSVAWPTDAGNLYVGIANAPGVRFRMQATDRISSAPAFLEPGKVFAASLDGYIYCINEAKGNILWRVTTGERITHSPVALDDKVFVISDRGSMYAIDAATALERWVTGGIRRYLAGNEKRLYCLDTRGNLAVLDAASGSRLASIPNVHSELPLINTQTDRILLVNSTGLVQCLREADLPWPVVHYQIEPQKKLSKAKSKEPKAKTEEKTDQKDIDPFATGGGKPAATAPAVAPPAASPDPFAVPPVAGAKPGTPPSGDPFANPTP
jgi:hypothetical protein